ncbi:MAG: hypothetical protein QXJ12_00560 [Candidatus Parvarchaeota archaeon]|nr:hypothetical protein [Candidatus Parvarchaeota archaeon]
MSSDLDDIVSSMELQDGLSFYLLVNRLKPSAMVDSLYVDLAEDYGLKSKYDSLGSSVFMSYDKELLEKLYEFDRTNDTFNMGLALGYPEEACRAFLRGWQRGTDFFMHVSRSFDKTGKLPIHLAYLPYVPEPEAVEDEDSPSSIIGKRNMEFVQEWAPKLSRKLEYNFKIIVLNIKYFYR